MSEKGVIVNKQGVSTDGTKGGLFVGKRHSQGGIEVDVVGGGKVEVETDEALIKNGSANTSKTVSFDGKQMTPKEVLSKINTSYGGVPIKKKGGILENGGAINYLLNDNLTDNISVESLDKLGFDDILYSNEPDKKRLKELNDYLKDNSNNLFVLYHGTDKKLPIKKDGLKTTSSKRRKSYQSESGYVYLSPFKETARTFGEMGNPYGSKVYEVKIPIRLLLADKDQLNNKRSVNDFAIGNTLAESIILGRSLRVKGNIPPYMIKETDFEKGGKTPNDDILKMGVKNYLAQRKSENESGKPVVVEGGAIVITRDAVLSNEKNEFNGKMLTNKEILSEINKMNGGVDFAKGGKIESDVIEKFEDGGGIDIAKIYNEPKVTFKDFHLDTFADYKKISKNI